MLNVSSRSHPDGTLEREDCTGERGSAKIHTRQLPTCGFPTGQSR
jgi:hypothetical protein